MVLPGFSYNSFWTAKNKIQAADTTAQRAVFEFASFSLTRYWCPNNSTRLKGDKELYRTLSIHNLSAFFFSVSGLCVGWASVSSYWVGRTPTQNRCSVISPLKSTFGIFCSGWWYAWNLSWRSKEQGSSEYSVLRPKARSFVCHKCSGHFLVVLPLNLNSSVNKSCLFIRSSNTYLTLPWSQPETSIYSHVVDACRVLNLLITYTCASLWFRLSFSTVSI